MSLRAVVAAVFIVLALTAAGGLGAYAWSESQDQEYVASAELLFGAPQPELVVIGGGSNFDSPPDERQAASNPIVVESPAIARRAAAATGIPAAEVGASISVGQVRDTNVVQITATRPTARQARALANAYAREYRALERGALKRRSAAALKALSARYRGLPRARRQGLEGVQLRQQIGQLTALRRVSGNDPRLVQSAALPAEPSFPRTQRNVIFAALFGALLGFATVAVLIRPRLARDDD